MFESYISIIVELCICLVLSILILIYFARRKTNIIIFITSLICWFMNLFLIILIPYDLYYTQSNSKDIPEKTSKFIDLGYKISYWVLFVLSWFIIPVMKEYENSGEFTMVKKLKASIISNIKFFLILGIIGLFGILFCAIKYGVRWTFLFVKNFSLIFGLVFFFFLLSYGLVKLPKTLYLKFKYDRHIKYLEWRIVDLKKKLSKISNDLITDFSRIKATIEKIDNEEEIIDLEGVENYLDEMKQKLSVFQEDAIKYGINLKRQKFEKQPHISRVNELININSKINSNQSDSLRLQCRLANSYNRWARLNTIANLSQLNKKGGNDKKIEDEINKLKPEKIVDESEKDKDENKEELIEENALEEKRFIPLENFGGCKLIFYGTIKKYYYIVLLILSILAGLAIIGCELCIVCGFTFITVFKKMESIVTIHLAMLIPLIYLIAMSNYTLFKIKLSSILYMYGPRQTDSVSLITFSSYLSRLYFAICLNFIQAINQFSKYQYRTKFEVFFGLDSYNFILYICRFLPIVLFVLIVLFIVLFIFNVPGKILSCCCGYNVFHFIGQNSAESGGGVSETEERIKNGHEYLMEINKELGGKTLKHTDILMFNCM